MATRKKPDRPPLFNEGELLTFRKQFYGQLPIVAAILLAGAAADEAAAFVEDALAVVDASILAVADETV